MTTSSFAAQPIGVKLAVAVTFLNSFVLIEEFVIDRHGLAKYLPLYRIGNVCTYDGIALVIILLAVFVLPGRKKPWLHHLRNALCLSGERDGVVRNCVVCRRGA